VTVYDMQDTITPQHRAGTVDRTVTHGTPTIVAADDKRLAALERRIDSLNREINRLRARPSVRPASGGTPSPDRTNPGNSGTLATPTADATGAFNITPEDEAYFAAVQERIQYRRRIDGMAQNVMRRVERLATRGEIGALDEPTKEKLKLLVHGYVTSSDALANRYLRKPDADMKAKTNEERRDLMAAERDRLVEVARQELVPLVGAVDAEKVAKETIQSPWGLRYRNRTGAGGSPRRRNR